jgi:hypothetical protein
VIDSNASASESCDDRPEVARLFTELKSSLPEMQTLLDECRSHWASEDAVYRFYHQSFKVFALQSQTLAIVKKLRSLFPGRELNRNFMQIILEGTGKTFSSEDNERWQTVTRPVVEAFFHAQYFLKMAVKYARVLNYPLRSMPSGWAALLCLFNLR